MGSSLRSPSSSVSRSRNARSRAWLRHALEAAREGRPFAMTPAKVRLAMASMGKLETKVGELCRELGISRPTHYRHVAPNGEVRPDGARVLARK